MLDALCGITGILLVGGVCLVLIALWAVMIYNRLITLKERIKNAWAQIDVQLKRRYDLIPNLIETVKGYAKHEKGIFLEVTKLRSKIMSGNPAERVEASDLLTNALKSLFAVAENYPNLRANENFLALQEELAGTENKISYVRMAYNDSILEYNASIKRFPEKLIAGLFGFNEETFLETKEEERKNVKVNF